MTFKPSLLVLSLALVTTALPAHAAKHCSKGQPCGNACISKEDVCHIDAGRLTRAQAPGTAAPIVAGKVKNCKKGKACGNSCIPAKAVCHATG